jgi:hypothetical protein
LGRAKLKRVEDRNIALGKDSGYVVTGQMLGQLLPRQWCPSFVLAQAPSLFERVYSSKSIFLLIARISEFSTFEAMFDISPMLLAW